MILFSQYLRNVRVPLPAYNQTNGFHKKHLRLFELFPVSVFYYGITEWTDDSRDLKIHVYRKLQTAVWGQPFAVRSMCF